MIADQFLTLDNVSPAAAESDFAAVFLAAGGAGVGPGPEMK